MSLDKDRLGTNIANAIIASRPAPGHVITNGELETMWQIVADEIIKEFNTFGVVGGLPAGSYIDGTAAPVTGNSGSLQGAIS